MHQRINAIYELRRIQLVILKLLSVDALVGDDCTTVSYLCYSTGVLYQLIIRTEQLPILEKIKLFHLDSSLIISAFLQEIAVDINSSQLNEELKRSAEFDVVIDKIYKKV